MQFHQNGYRPGDPAVSDPVAATASNDQRDPLPAEVDLLIVGSGPTGLTLAAQLAAFPSIATCVVEAKPGPLKVGQADGIACRSVEMFHAFGFAHKVLHEAYWVNETVFWDPDPERPDHVRRSDRIQDVEDGLSEMPHVILNQARVHDFYLEVMRNAVRPIVPHYGHRLIDLELPANDRDPVIAVVEPADQPGTHRRVRARYVVGCDGARSQVRRSMGRALVGDTANQAWGVMDVLGTTDFPDIRFKVIMHSASEGSLIIIPREGGFMVRLYVELDKLDADERAADRDISLDELVAAANRILHPYSIAPTEVPWWSIYEIGQRLCDRFDDLDPADDPDKHPRVFIAGDACHTHSPKAGQGMNVSMRDGFNLGWKLASVLSGQARESILGTYSDERHGLAKQLIDFDRELAAMMNAAPKLGEVTGEGDGNDGVKPADFQRYFQQAGRFTAGVATTYGPSIIVGSGRHQQLAKGFAVGSRFHSSPVTRLADGREVHLGQVARADGRWRLYAFGDRHDPTHADSMLAGLGRFLDGDSRSPIVRYTPEAADADSAFDVRAVLQQSHRDIDMGSVPDCFAPRVGSLQLVDYEKVLCAPTLDGVDVFDLRAVDRGGALVVVRPDQHVAEVLPLDAFDELARFFDAFMLRAPRG